MVMADLRPVRPLLILPLAWVVMPGNENAVAYPRELPIDEPEASPVVKIDAKGDNERTGGIRPWAGGRRPRGLPPVEEAMGLKTVGDAERVRAKGINLEMDDIFVEIRTDKPMIGLMIHKFCVVWTRDNYMLIGVNKILLFD
mmetsp:Transcript_25371/g.51637  ORF Transcript_25371/g.51637 Transcript_25371/m.51637 type:complete len:142 (+) Transcript_25371:328-753(+)